MNKAELKQLIKEVILCESHDEVKVQTDAGTIASIDIKSVAENIVKSLKDDNRNMRFAWQYIDSANSYILLSPTRQSGLKGRAELNQMIYDYIKNNNLFKKIN